MAAAQPRLGVLGGSFDPPHLAHLAIASEACHALGLERVLFVPGGGAAAQGWRRAHVGRGAARDDVAGRRRRPALHRLRHRDRARAASTPPTRCARWATRYADHDLVFIMGSDSLLQLETWHEPEELLSLCSLAVAPRPGDSPEAIAAAAARWGDYQVDAAGRAAAGRLVVGHPCAGRRGAAPSATWCRTAWSSTSWRRGSTGDGHRQGGGRGARRRPAVPAPAGPRPPRGGGGRRPGARGSAPPRRRPRSPACCTTTAASCPTRRPWPRPPGTASPWVRSRRGARRRSCTDRSPPPSCSTSGWTRRSPRPSRLHTVGDAGMTVLEKCLYLADYLRARPRLPGHRPGPRAGARRHWTRRWARPCASACSTSSAGAAGWSPGRWRCTTRLMPAT